MNSLNDYTNKFNALTGNTLFHELSEPNQKFIREKAYKHQFSFQDIRQISEIALDLKLWDAPALQNLWPDEAQYNDQGKALKKRLLSQIHDEWQALREKPNHYRQHDPLQTGIKIEPVAVTKGKLGLGRCPVASPRTLCCNLMTLDAVDNCGYGCSYCSIQSFFDGKQISFDRHFAEKLSQLNLDPDQIYHIGTGQSSDSLMWGNSHGVLEALLAFARQNPNVILEFKTKSANVSYLLKQDLPANILFTWSLNTPVIIQYEEHGTVSLEKRLDAAQAIAEHGGLVGFHFHPMVHYENWQDDYSQLFETLMQRFEPAKVALVSLGTLTFIKSVMKEIRSRGIHTQILKMPLSEADGKLSYPDDIKLQMFKHAYQSFNQHWQEQVFFYLCMENSRLWEPVFGKKYLDNENFEAAMKTAYLKKIRRLQQTAL